MPSESPQTSVAKAGHAGYPRKTGQLEDSHRDLKCRKARPRWLRIQKPEALMLQSVPPYVDTRHAEGRGGGPRDAGFNLMPHASLWRMGSAGSLGLRLSLSGSVWPPVPGPVSVKNARLRPDWRVAIAW